MPINRLLTIRSYLPILEAMGRRKQGTLLPLEVRILEIVDESELGGNLAYGFSIASTLSGKAGKTLAAHGTLYKALARMTDAGLLDAQWEDPEIAEREGRPRRRLYRITTPGKGALQLAQVAPARKPVPAQMRPVRA